MASVGTASSSAPLRAIFNAAIEAIKGPKVMQKVITFNRETKELFILDPHNVLSSRSLRSYNLENRKIYIIGAGKGVLGLCVGFLRRIEESNFAGSSIACGVLSVPIGLTVKQDEKQLLDKYNVEIHHGAKDNIPDQEAVKTTDKILSLIDKINAQVSQPTLVVAFVTGGGSALLCKPKHGLELSRKQEIIERLMKSGCGIVDLNKVRRCLSPVKGGKLALRLLQSAPHVELVTFLASDIIGDPLDLIASGPTVPLELDSSGLADEAISILRNQKVDLDDQLIALIRNGEEKWMEQDKKRLLNLIVVNNETALKAASDQAINLGYEVRFIGRDISGEASAVAERFLDMLSKEGDENKATCWLAGGETVVTLDASSTGKKTGKVVINCFLIAKNVRFMLRVR